MDTITLALLASRCWWSLLATKGIYLEASFVKHVDV